MNGMHVYNRNLQLESSLQLFKQLGSFEKILQRVAYGIMLTYNQLLW